MEKAGVLAGILALVVFAVFASWLGDVTGYAVSNAYSASGGRDVMIYVGESEVVLEHHVVRLTGITKGNPGYSNNKLFDNHRIRIVVDGRPAVLYEGQIKVIGDTVVGVNEVNWKSGYSRLMVKKVNEPAVDTRDRYLGYKDYSLSTLPEPFVSGMRPNKILIVTGESPNEKELKAADLISEWIDDLTGKRITVRSMIQGSGNNIPSAEGRQLASHYNLILVGRAETHSLISDILGSDRFSSEALFEEEGFVEVIDNGNKAIMIVTGNSPEDVLRAASAVKGGAQMEGAFAYV